MLINDLTFYKIKVYFFNQLMAIRILPEGRSVGTTTRFAIHDTNNKRFCEVNIHFAKYMRASTLSTLLVIILPGSVHVIPTSTFLDCSYLMWIVETFCNIIVEQ